MTASRLLTLSMTAASAVAQCSWSSVSVSSYGQGCSPFGLGAALNVSASPHVSQCRLDLDVTPTSGCCGTAAVGTVLALGFAPVSVPAPVLGAGCTLLASPGLLIYRSATAGSTFPLLFLAPQLPPVTFHVQAASLFFSSSGPSYAWVASAGARVDLH